MKSGLWKLAKLTKVARNAATRLKPRGKKRRAKQFNMILQALHYFCTQTSLHGLRYVVDRDLHGIERFLWLILFVISCTTASKVIVQLADRFQVSHQWKEWRLFRIAHIISQRCRLINYSRWEYLWYWTSMVSRLEHGLYELRDWVWNKFYYLLNWFDGFETKRFRFEYE